MRRRQAILLAMYPIKKRLFLSKPGEKVLRILRKKQREQLIRQEEAQNHLLLLQQQYRFEQPHSIITTHAPSISSNSSQDSYRDTRSPNPIANLAPMYQQQHLPQTITNLNFNLHRHHHSNNNTLHINRYISSHSQYHHHHQHSSYCRHINTSNGTSFYFLLSQSPSYMQYPAHIIQAGHTLPQNVVPNHPNPPSSTAPPIVPQQPPQPYPQNNHSVVFPPQAAKLPIAPSSGSLK